MKITIKYNREALNEREIGIYLSGLMLGIAIGGIFGIALMVFRL